jgi:ribosomal protein L40E
MNCKKCGSKNIQLLAGNSKVKSRGIIPKIMRLILIICTMGFWLVMGKKKETVKTTTTAVCMTCGNKWTI